MVPIKSVFVEVSDGGEGVLAGSGSSGEVLDTFECQTWKGG